MAGGTFTQTGIAKAYDMMNANTDRTVTVKGQTVYAPTENNNIFSS